MDFFLPAAFRPAWVFIFFADFLADFFGIAFLAFLTTAATALPTLVFLAAFSTFLRPVRAALLVRAAAPSTTTSIT
ncbi:MAG: hypothetical protein QOJ42_271 [Acidobacteriaceae bacterium]|nr:hypothetical protein [Acidobacteriaceae bacterium]